jgi:hypothetical protein
MSCLSTSPEASTRSSPPILGDPFEQFHAEVGLELTNLLMHGRLSDGIGELAGCARVAPGKGHLMEPFQAMQLDHEPRGSGVG